VRAGLYTVIFLAACGPPPRKAVSVPLFTGGTDAVLTGHRCVGKAGCSCRKPGEGDLENLPVAEGKKRYELRLETNPGAGYVLLDGMRFYQSRETSQECWYVDLAVGDHKVQVQGVAERKGSPVGLAFTLAEYQPAGPAWYDAFTFSCGAGTGCELADLKELRRQIQVDRRKVSDPCGTARILGVSWDSGRAPDGLHPNDVTLGFTLTVSPREPESRPWDPSCRVEF